MNKSTLFFISALLLPMGYTQAEGLTDLTLQALESNDPSSTFSGMAISQLDTSSIDNHHDSRDDSREEASQSADESKDDIEASVDESKHEVEDSVDASRDEAESVVDDSHNELKQETESSSSSNI